MAVATDDDKVKVLPELFGPGDHFQAVASGHPDVGDQQVRLVLPHHFQGFFPIVRHRDNLHVEGAPIDQIANQLANFDFVVRNDNFYHLVSPSPLRQRVATHRKATKP